MLCVYVPMLHLQTQKWGNVEWYHDLDVYELQARVAAATLFIHWCNESSSVTKQTDDMIYS